MTPYKLYGVPLSQPFRSVAWALLKENVPFQVQLTVPGMKGTIGTNGESFLAKTKGKTGTVPLLEIEPDFCISEAPAILHYLCETHEWNYLYPTKNLRQKYLINSYLHWHHSNTRMLANLTMPYLRPDLQTSDAAATFDEKPLLQQLDSAWLADTNYIAGNENATIADLMLYGEVSQATYMGVVSLANYPRLMEWCARMKDVEGYEPVHAALALLGNVTDSNDTPVAKRLGQATKAGMAALVNAQSK
jgi:glutathione S-transferase